MLAWGLDVATYIYIAGLLISVALALAQKKPQLASLDDIFSSTATQGAYLPLVIGRQRVPTIVLWVEDAGVSGVSGFASGTAQGQFAKGGGSTPASPSYLERALHGLCVGPATELRAIYQNNEILWQGSITPVNTPSGTAITVFEPDGTTSTFKIYWGFPEDPVLPYLGASLTHGVPTRYSHSVKVLWDVKRLGQTRQWPRLEYEVVCPCYSSIASTPPEILRNGSDLRPSWKEWSRLFTARDPYWLANPGAFYTSDKEPVTHPIRSVNPSKRSLLLFECRFGGLQPTEEWVSIYPAGGLIKIGTHSGGTQAGQAIPGIGYGAHTMADFGITSDLPRVFRIAESKLVATSQQAGVFIYTLEITLGEEVVSPEEVVSHWENSIFGVNPIPNLIGGVALPIGRVEPIDTLSSDGINPVHLLDQLLFSRYPYGAGRDRSKFDSHSIEVSSQVLQDEVVRGGMSIENGEGLESIIGKILQDIGLAIPYNPLTGLYTFRLLRYEQTFTNIPREMILEEVSMENVPGDRPADVLAFTFNDRERNYREAPIRVQDNGQIVETETQKSTKVPISVTSDRDSVQRMAPRRSQEALGAVSSFTFQLSHKATLAMAGSRFRCDSLEDPNVQFIVGTVKRSLETNKVEVVAVLDAYDPPEQTQGALAATIGLPPPPAAGSTKKTVDPLTGFVAIEVPRALASDRRQVEILFAASRKSSATIGARVWISADGLSYVELSSAVLVAQGTLESPLSASGPCYDADGLHELSGASEVDLGAIEDLTLYPDSWRAGRQVLLVGSEVIFLRNAYLTYSGESGVEGVLTGLIRGRAGTLQQDHAEGTPFYVLYAHRVERQTSPAFLPGRTIHYKVGAQEIRRNEPIGGVAEQEIELQGLAMRPLKPSALRLAGFQRAYSSIDDLVEVVWAYHSTEFPRTGLGNQTCGAASGLSKPAGHFLVTISPPGGGPDHVEMVETASIVLDSTLRTTLGLDTGGSWTLKVAHVEGSFTSEQAVLTLNSY